MRNFIFSPLNRNISLRHYTTKTENVNKHSQFETVYSFPFIKYISVLNRLKVYQMFGSSLAIPGSGLMEILEILPYQSCLSTSYIAITGSALLSLASLPFRNAIGFLYISEDNKLVKISSMDFWGRRKDRIVPIDDWIPISEMPPKYTDVLYLSPYLSDGTKYKLFIRFGNVLNSKKMGQTLE